MLGIAYIAAQEWTVIQMADEYISKQSVIDYLNGYLHSIGGDNLFDSGQRRALTNAIQDISAIKAADVQPVKHAYWEEKQDMNGDTYYHCTNCKEDFVLVEGTPKDNLYYYCPNCGAKMDLKDGENE